MPEYTYEGQRFERLRDALLQAIRESIEDGGGSVWIHAKDCAAEGAEECPCKPISFLVPPGSAIA